MITIGAFISGSRIDGTLSSIGNLHEITFHLSWCFRHCVSTVFLVSGTNANTPARYIQVLHELLTGILTIRLLPLQKYGA